MAITVADLTEAEIKGNGVFDVLMRSVEEHIEREYKSQRIKGPEYSTVYLGSLQSVLQNSIQFLLQKDKSDLEQQLIAKQIEKLDKEMEVLDKEICKLNAEFDVLVLQKDKVVAETALLDQKRLSEQAQIQAAGVDADSVLGRQKALYEAQATGFTRDAEQKVAKLMIDSWNVRRTTDEGVSANPDNKLDDVNIGRAVDKMLTGVNA